MCAPNGYAQRSTRKKVYKLVRFWVGYTPFLGASRINITNYRNLISRRVRGDLEEEGRGRYPPKKKMKKDEISPHRPTGFIWNGACGSRLPSIRNISLHMEGGVSPEQRYPALVMTSVHNETRNDISIGNTVYPSYRYPLYAICYDIKVA